MSLVGKVGRRRPRAVLAMAVVYALLLLGALTTLYPFAIMVSTGLKGATDQNDGRLVPAFLREDAELLAKYRQDKYAGDLTLIDSLRGGTVPASGSADLDQDGPGTREQDAPTTRGGTVSVPDSAADLEQDAPGTREQDAPTTRGGTVPVPGPGGVSPPESGILDRDGPGTGERDAPTTFGRFLQNLDQRYWTAGFRNGPGQLSGRLQRRYQDWLRAKYANDVDAVNRAYTEEAVGFQTITPPTEMPERRTWRAPDDRKFREWIEFKKTLPVEFRVPVRETRMWQEFLRGKYGNRPSAMPPEVARGATAFEAIPLPPPNDPLYREFRAKALPDRFRNGAVERLYGSDVPMAAWDAAWVRDHGPEIRREFAGRNYAFVLDYVLLNGRAVWNTVVFCGLAVLTQLIVNPLAAYALSRYPVRQSGRILIFLLATMAFPAEVAMIPSFLLLRDLGLLNTFAALVLPTAASGYMIFLLKGFFDSLPQELYEAGQLDGAPETTMLARIALPLSRPVLGYLALIAFMGSYGAFLYAFLVVQDQRMWTLTVWVYQLQATAPRAVMMAALTLAAVPTLAVFLLAQRAILRGIVLPGER